MTGLWPPWVTRFNWVCLEADEIAACPSLERISTRFPQNDCIVQNSWLFTIQTS